MHHISDKNTRSIAEVFLKVHGEAIEQINIQAYEYFQYKFFCSQQKLILYIDVRVKSLRHRVFLRRLATLKTD